MPEFRRVLRSEEHTSELQSHDNLVCRLLLEKKKQTTTQDTQLRTGLRQSRLRALPRPVCDDRGEVCLGRGDVRFWCRRVFCVFFLKKSAPPQNPHLSPPRPPPD